MKDMANKGRASQNHGTNNPCSKLTDFDVLNIRELFSSGISQAKLSGIYQVNFSLISLIVLNKNWTHLLNRTLYDGVDTMPDVLFVIINSESKAVYHCHSILELFRLRTIFNTPSDAKLYRFVKNIVYSDIYLKWNKGNLCWELSDRPQGIGFGLTTFESLIPAYRILGGK
jgi:hypothetical protein